MSTQDPFALLLKIQELSLLNAKGLPQQREVQDIWSGVGFSLGNKLYVSPLGEVAETMKIPKITRLPKTRNWVVGIANIRGGLTPVLDLGRFLLRHPSQASSRCRILVVEEEELTRGLLVDAVHGMQRLSEGTFSRQVRDVPETIFPFVRGSFRKGDEEWTILNLRALIAQDAFQEVALETASALQ